jgi:FdhD protein
MSDPDCEDKPPSNLIRRAVTREYEILDVTEKGIEQTWVEVCVEDTVNLHINGVRVASLTVTPEYLEEYTYGYLICEGLVSGIHSIKGVNINLPDIHVEVTDQKANIPVGNTEIRSSGCVGVKTTWENLNRPVGEGIRVNLETLFEGMRILNKRAATWRTTGGTHCTVILDKEGNVQAVMEDMGRHNSIDKAVGKALLSGVDLSQCFITCTGRLPAGMVAKAYRAGLSVMASNTAPFSTGICLARQVNMTLAGFTRPPRVMIYSAPERIILPESLPRL